MLLTALPSAQQMLHKILAMEDNKRMEIMLLLWTWWDVRNKVNADDSMISVDQVLYKIRSMAGEIINKDAKVNRKNGRVSRWFPAMPEVIKIKIDGTFLANQKKGSWGFSARDHEGQRSWLVLDQ